MDPDDFPYKRNNARMESDIARRFRSLTSYRARFAATKYHINNAPDFDAAHLRFAISRASYLMILNARDYDEYNLISDYFIEHIRIRALRGDDSARESIYDYWINNRARIRAQCHDDVCARELIYAEKMEVGTFRPTVAMGIIQMMRNILREGCDYILNPCAGWGDRLIGFMASSIRGCIDVDPNIELGSEYARIIDWAREVHPSLRDTFQEKYIAQPFEDIDDQELRKLCNQMRGDDVGFDLAMIAPPYFDLEIYVPNDVRGTQSISRYGTFELWYRKFLIISIQKCARHIRHHGIVAVIINQAPIARADPRARFLHNMVRDVTRTREVSLRYLGVISYAEVDGKNVRSPQPIWLWQRE